MARTDQSIRKVNIMPLSLRVLLFFFKEKEQQHNEGPEGGGEEDGRKRCKGLFFPAPSSRDAEGHVVCRFHLLCNPRVSVEWFKDWGRQTWAGKRKHTHTQYWTKNKQKWSNGIILSAVWRKKNVHFGFRVYKPQRIWMLNFWLQTRRHGCTYTFFRVPVDALRT